MSAKIRDGLKTSINTYLALILLILPLYAPDGYVMIGNAKYLFFRNVTLFFVAVTTVMLFLSAVVQKGREEKHGGISGTDFTVLLYGAGAVVSACFSADGYTAWYGAPGWYMGLLSQLMFVWIYFAASRWCDDFERISKAFFAGVVIVMTLGILNRYGFDPFLLSAGLDDWNRGHLLSTIGNLNWYCGYVSVASAVCICFVYTGGRIRRAAGLAGCLLFFWTLMTQGSEGGYLIPAAEMAVAFLLSLENRRKLASFSAVCLCWPAAALIGQYCIRFSGLILVEDGSLAGLLFWKGWPYALLLCALSSLLLYVREKRGCTDRLKSGKIQKITLWAAGAFFAAGAAVFLMCQLWDDVWRFLGEKELLRISDSWGNGRGALWRCAAGCFVQGSFSDKLIGVGPDCFGNALSKWYPANYWVNEAGQWETAFYANAHNEWLNMLVSQGILGLLFYGGIFMSVFVRLWKQRNSTPFAVTGLLAIAGYCAYGTVSFQQTVSTPLMFAILGMSEAMLRKGTGDPLCALSRSIRS